MPESIEFMKPSLTRILMTSATLLLWSAAAFAGDGITAVTGENGRKVFLNNSDIPHALDLKADAHAPRLSGSGITTKYVYWSRTAHRWKPVPLTSAAALRARTAAAEVLVQSVNETASAASAGGTAAPASDSATTFVSSEKVNAAISHPEGCVPVVANSSSTARVAGLAMYSRWVCRPATANGFPLPPQGTS